MTSPYRHWHHWHMVYDRIGPGAQPLGSIEHEHAEGSRPHLGHVDEAGRQLPWGRPHLADPMEARMRRAGAVVADDPERGKVWVPKHLRDRPN